MERKVAAHQLIVWEVTAGVDGGDMDRLSLHLLGVGAVAGAVSTVAKLGAAGILAGALRVGVAGPLAGDQDTGAQQDQTQPGTIHTWGM